MPSRCEQFRGILPVVIESQRPDRTVTGPMARQKFGFFNEINGMHFWLASNNLSKRMTEDDGGCLGWIHLLIWLSAGGVVTGNTVARRPE